MSSPLSLLQVAWLPKKALISWILVQASQNKQFSKLVWASESHKSHFKHRTMILFLLSFSCSWSLLSSSHYEGCLKSTFESRAGDETPSFSTHSWMLWERKALFSLRKGPRLLSVQWWLKNCCSFMPRHARVCMHTWVCAQVMPECIRGSACVCTCVHSQSICMCQAHTCVHIPSWSQEGCSFLPFSPRASWLA